MDFLKRLDIQEVNPGAFSGQGWHSEIGASRLASFNPANSEKLAEVATCSLKDYEHVMERAQKAALTWREVPAPQRGEIIRQIGQALREHKDLLGSLVSLEMGKSKQEGDGEVQEMIDIADFAVGQSRMLYGKTMHSERPQHRMYEQWHPYGIVGVISAFNFPVAVWSWNAFIAAICGNITLWKPSAKTPLCAIAVHHICNQVLRKNNCPEIFGLIIPESHEIAEAMVNDSRIPLISFTGSTAVGRQVAAKVASRLGKTILELGGNNAIILDEAADLNLAIPAIVFGAVGTAGQRCTSTRRLFVHQSMLKDVVKRLQHAYEQVTIGDPLDSKNLMGPLIDEQAVKQFKNAISRISAAGGQLVFGGEALNKAGYFVQPTLVTEVENHWDIVQEETFAPILYVMPYSTMKEAIALQNGVPQGLSSALFTQNLKNAELYLSAAGSDCGIANINIGTSGAEIGGAFGGEKETGGGRESGSDSWKAYMRRQTNTINWGDALPLAQGIRFNLS
ncbi:MULTISPECIES: aldehyde dehydrogenase family protein [unclassified Legionella]|uniref:L-piperidine-6-carboxylate dehydrogenase n=1 Tax=unclassified Legionella TaxID=2622702 RepID=UPI001054C0B6|nr:MULTISPECIES: aldehyde dehydrogenase family protein [unclassified Legionella]MDI9818861.1 aldehyde dehydrogenase family protein [Legionella sp. PL877]